MRMTDHDRSHFVGHDMVQRIGHGAMNQCAGRTGETGKGNTGTARRHCCAAGFRSVYVGSGSNSVVPVMSAARSFFPRKRTSIRDLAMSQRCQNRTEARRSTLVRLAGGRL
jgi:hypothetical protein